MAAMIRIYFRDKIASAIGFKEDYKLDKMNREGYCEEPGRKSKRNN